MDSNVLFLNRSKTALIYAGYKYSGADGNNKNGKMRWRCSTCQAVTITTYQDVVIRYNDKQHSPKCKKLTSMQIECVIKYSELKSLSKTSEFSFKNVYKNFDDELKNKFPGEDSSEFWPNKNKAHNCISSIRKKRRKNQDESVVQNEAITPDPIETLHFVYIDSVKRTQEVKQVNRMAKSICTVKISIYEMHAALNSIYSKTAIRGKLFLFNIEDHWVIITDKQGNSMENSSEFIFYDCFNKPEYYLLALKSELKKLAPVNSKSIIIDVINVATQAEKSDCGLFCLAYMIAINNNKNLNEIAFDTSIMKAHFIQAMQTNIWQDFPGYYFINEPSKFVFEVNF